MHRISRLQLRLFGLLALLATPVVSLAGDGLLEFSEKQVAGTADDMLIARHVRMRGSNTAIGRKLAEIARERHHVELGGEASETARARWDWYRKNYPTQYERAVGAAEFYGAPVGGPVEAMALIFNMDVAPGCSVVYYPPGFTAAGHPILSRNYDFSTATWSEFRGGKPIPGARPCTGDVYVLEVYPDKGYPSLFLCAYELLGGAIDGINSKGLTVALLANHEEQGAPPAQPSGGWQPGLAELEIGRYVLERCATAAEARTALKDVDYYYSFIPCHYIIGDATGQSFVWEYSVDRDERHVVAGGGKPQAVTNHALYVHGTGGEAPANASGANTFVRYHGLCKDIAAAPKARSIDDIKQANAAVAMNAPARPGRKPGRTLWHALYDCTALTLDVDFYLSEDADGGGKQRRSGYLHFQLEPPKPSNGG